MKFECIANALNLRAEPRGTVLAELRFGDLFEVAAAKANAEWVHGAVLSGVSIGKKGYVRRKWLIQRFDSPPTIAPLDRTEAARIIAKRTVEFDGIHYDLGSKAKTWKELKKNGYVDCSGWVYLLGKELIEAYQLTAAPSELYTYSDEQIINCGSRTKTILSGRYLSEELFPPAVLVGVDIRRIFVGSWPSMGYRLHRRCRSRRGRLVCITELEQWRWRQQTKFPCGGGCPIRTD
ncbi:hypothetical protein SAMN04244579_04563 [Azotobacter beijerinckii]|uniref:SH3 domain-containing protein n=1 Tax=Azotobacter beijerinckii TaxID=170623 RepID=A0A1H6Z577_9GAMM|nr:hypothetical protein [Azotobacter beijerinckii]SEJ48591.1 hypothetical protein SAMN04244579_04563 [Azotobacter beijerinckii]